MTSTIATSSLSFDHRSMAVAVHFGRGRFEDLASVLEAAGLSQPLVISTPDQAPLALRAAELLGGRCVGVHAEAVVHVPVPVAARGVDVARSRGARSLVAVGGGSAIGLAKAITLEEGLPILAVPTTFAGSEMTPCGA
jgi:maleylacetate reductase